MKEEIEEIENTLKFSKPYNELGTYNYFNCESIEKLLEENKSLQSQLKEKEEVIKEAREYVNHSKKNIDESGMYVETYTKWKLVSDVLDDLLEILSKGENK